jgi:hypothetical protein
MSKRKELEPPGLWLAYTENDSDVHNLGIFTHLKDAKELVRNHLTFILKHLILDKRVSNEDQFKNHPNDSETLRLKDHYEYKLCGKDESGVDVYVRRQTHKNWHPDAELLKPKHIELIKFNQKKQEFDFKNTVTYDEMRMFYDEVDSGYCQKVFIKYLKIDEEVDFDEDPENTFQ